MLVSWLYKYRNSPMDHIDPRARWIFSFAFLIAATSPGTGCSYLPILLLHSSGTA